MALLKWWQGDGVGGGGVDGVDERFSSLLNIKGFGVGGLRKLVSSFGGPEKLIECLEKGDVAAISSAHRISERRAVDLILAYRGESSGTILRTEGSREIHTAIREILRSYMRTSTARNRVSLLLPCGEMKDREKQSQENFQTKSLLEGVKREDIERDLSTIGKEIPARKSSVVSNYVLVPESDNALKSIQRHGLDRKCMVLSPDDLGSGFEGEVVLVYDMREIEERDLPVTAFVHMNSAPEMIVPEIVLERYERRIEQFRALSRLERAFCVEGCSEEAVRMLTELMSVARRISGPVEVRERVEEIRIDLERELKERVEALTLSGSDALSLLSSDEPPALREIYRDISRKAMDTVREGFGRKMDLFEMGYPLTTNEQALERMIKDIEDQESSERFSMKQELASGISALEKKLEEEISWALDLDYRFGMGCFVSDHELNPFKLVEGWFGIHGACHLMIRSDDEKQLIDYHLGDVPPYASAMFPFRESSSSRTALLTGANSGGKTTLLETIAQVMIMARMGLPVPAEKSFLPDISDIFLYKPRRKLDAGGLEGFLAELLPMVLEVDQGSMVLADELEAMTELEAASRVIGTFVDEVQKRDAYSVIVTHMAAEIMRFVNCRVDGIEARGLDDNYELIVDRTPLIGKHARSTPELILKKLEARSEGPEKEIYTRILRTFDDV
jgi:hypothetical protein